MARDRQRAKRRQRRAQQNPGAAPGRAKPLHRDNVPGELDHASGQVDQFEAALVAGGEGVASDEPLDVDVDADAELAAEPELDAGHEPAAEPAARYDADADADAALDADEAVDEDALGAGAGDVAAPAAATAAGQAPARRSGNSVVNFLRASWAELQRVQWPDRRQVGQATAVVLGFVVIAGAFLGLADALAQEVVNIIL
jgi:preprotein translocase SecE subunit